MRLLILSDLHLEHGAATTVPVGLDYDVVALAGDIGTPGSRAVHWAALASSFQGRPIVYVPGPHEFYGQEISSELHAMRAAAAGTGVHVLSRGTVVIDGVRFVGCTLWTDFALPVYEDCGPADGVHVTDVERAMAMAGERLADYRIIELVDPSILCRCDRPSKRRLLRPADTLAMHHIERDWLRRELEAGHAGPTVVITHHAPHRRSLSRYDWLSPAFVNDLPASFFEGETMWSEGKRLQSSGPALWIHGHTHKSVDYMVGDCRIVSNPRGYRDSEEFFENKAFDAGLIVEVKR